MSLRFNPITAKLDLVEDKASKISIADTGGYFSGTTVEIALQEIGSGITLDDNYVNVIGDTMTGNLVIQNGVTSASAYRYGFNTLSGLTLGSDIAPINYTITAQSPFSTAVTNVTGADLILNAGAGVGVATTARDGKVHINGFQIRTERLLNWGRVASSTSTDDYGAYMLFTTSGSDATRRIGLQVDVIGTFSGNEFTQALGFLNSSDGISTLYISDTSVFSYRPTGDRGIFGGAVSISAGIKQGGVMLAGGSNNENYGSWSAATITRSLGMNIGVFGAADNRSVGVLVGTVFAGAFVLGTRTAQPVNRSTSVALLCDNAELATDIFVALDGGTDVYEIADFGTHILTQIANTTGATSFWVATTAANTGRTAVTEVINFNFNSSATQTWALGAGPLATQRETVFQAPTYAGNAAEALTITTAATVYISGAPVQGTNMTLSNTYALWVDDGVSAFGGNVVPDVSDGAALGTTALMWSDLFLASGGRINFNNGDVLIDHSSNELEFKGATAYQFDAYIGPTVTDGSALGDPAGNFLWSDLFLANGAVINFNFGDALLTHASNSLTFTGAAIINNSSQAVVSTFSPFTVNIEYTTRLESDRTGSTNSTIQASTLILNEYGDTTPATTFQVYALATALDCDAGGGTIESGGSIFIADEVATGATLTDHHSIRISNPIAGGTITNNYGIRIDTQTSGGSDYGLYIGGADTNAVWVDSGDSRFDGDIDLDQGTGLIRHNVTAGITASTTQTQGQGALTVEVNEISVVANANDTVTLPSAVAGYRVVIINNGANTLKIFPASGDNLGVGVDASTTLASGSNAVYQAYDNTNWESI